jgi:hypothetical protein
MTILPSGCTATLWPMSPLVPMGVVTIPLPSATTGTSFTAVTLSVMVLALASVLMPPLAVPPLSVTWNVKEA